MKRKFEHPPREERPMMWRSLDELESSPEFDEWLQREFPQGADVYEDSGYSRRDFMKLMGASMALAGVGLAGCRRPEAHLVPFKEAAEFTIPGKPLYYATAMPTRRGVIPLIATTVDGRPIKMEGNPLHPASNGGTDGFAQASILDLYDPHRAKEILFKGTAVDRATYEKWVAEVSQRYSGKGEGLAFLVEKTNSPTRERLRSDLERLFPNHLWVEYEPLGDTNAADAVQAAFGRGVRLQPDFEQADVILALDSDFLNVAETGVGFASGFFTRRNPNQQGRSMNRLYVAENHYTLTGGMADHRVRVKSSQIGAFACAIGAQIAAMVDSPKLDQIIKSSPESSTSFDPNWVHECAADLVSHAGKALVWCGPYQPASVQAVCLAINEALGAFGSVIKTLQSAPQAPVASIEELAAQIQQGAVKTLFMLGGNPVYNAPSNLNFSSLLASVPESMHLALFRDETSKLATWQVPAAHYLESWSDGWSANGIYTAIQPMILPLWGAISDLEVLAGLMGRTKLDGPELIKETFGKISGVSGDSLKTRWNDFLRTGFLENTAWATVNGSYNSNAVAELAKGLRVNRGPELVFIQSSSVDDGRYANNAWLQETPDFVTKLTWDNAVLISPHDAERLGIKDGDIVAISAAGRQIEAGVHIAAGHADDSLSIALGYGRQDVSALMQNVGFDAYPLRTTENTRFRTDVNIAKTGKRYDFAQTQHHHSMEGRDLAREGTIERFQKEPTFAQHMGFDSHLPPLVQQNQSLFTHPKLTSKEQWAMAIDLNTCIGCNACLVACRAENNVPVVGKDQVRRGREMAWIRIDRWFAGEPKNPEMVAMTILCQHCENAPCETVCPVNATVHSEDGLNLMAYNRCIGTRYCANNCPWKVRRFNFFDYNQRPIDKLYWGPVAKKGTADSIKMSKNPNVTVRMRGVMEKCTFCIQRIEEAKIARLVEAGGRDKNEFEVGPFKTACQQACPSEAIVFGNQNDPESAVAKLRKSDRGYMMFNYLNTRPRITYLARIKNPNSKMPGAELVGNINTSGHGEHGEHDASHGDLHQEEGDHDS